MMKLLPVKLPIIFCALCMGIVPMLLAKDLSDKEKPNILFFFTDDQAYDTLGVYGNPDVKTPNIDRLGELGVVFDRHYNTTSICMASRASVMTGLYEYKTGCNFKHGPAGETQWGKSYPLLLKDAGYKVGFAGKFGFHVGEDSKEEGERAKRDFDFWLTGSRKTKFFTKDNPDLARYAEEYPHVTRAFGAATIEFLQESVNSDEPFCMSLFFKAPHKPAVPDPSYDDIYKDTEFRKLPNYGRAAGEHFSMHSQKGRQFSRFHEWGYAEEKSYQEELRKYHQQIYGVDQAIGMILNELRRLGIADSTVVVFSSDNGFFNGSHGLGSKVLPYEEGTRVPLIVYDPRNPRSGTMRRSNALTGGVDITATLLDIAGIAIPESYDGNSLLPILEDTENEVRESLPHIQVWGPEATRCLSIVTPRYKYIYWYYRDESEGLYPKEELYDLKKDPYEMTNVVANPEMQSTLDQLRARYDAQIEHWKREGVKRDEYEEYEILFDRNVPWDAKAGVLNLKGLGM